ncbi:RNA-directed DNA polymerase, eukaryota, reverse transcriptase zinc-binding domain protein [Tanacetum coccineum]
MVEEKTLRIENGGQETLWNKCVPKKVNIFVWKALKGRLPVREELDKRGIDLDSTSCSCCDSVAESKSLDIPNCVIASLGKRFKDTVGSGSGIWCPQVLFSVGFGGVSGPGLEVVVYGVQVLLLASFIGLHLSMVVRQIMPFAASGFFHFKWFICWDA